jgi:hypothetical protein
VGAGKSGAEIAAELVPTRPRWLAGREVGEVPVRHGSLRGRLALPLIRFIGHPVLDADGRPVHGRGIARAEPDLAFVGLPFQYAATSDVLPGVGRDARWVAEHVAAGARAAGDRAAPRPEVGRARI